MPDSATTAPEGRKPAPTALLLLDPLLLETGAWIQTIRSSSLLGSPAASVGHASVTTLVATGKPCIKRPTPATYRDEKNQAAEHGKIGARVAKHVPETLVCAKQLWHLCSGNRGCDHDQQRDGYESRPQPQQEKETAENLESADKIGREVRMWKPNSGEANHAHVGVDVLQNALCKEDQTHSHADQKHGSRTVW